MYFVNSWFTVAIYLSLIVGVVIVALRWSRSLAVEHRMQRMMLCCGIDRDAAISADEVLKLDMDAARRRCRNCPVTEMCDRWLNGESVATNSFCPNAWHFISAADAGRLSSDSGYMSRWISEP